MKENKKHCLKNLTSSVTLDDYLINLTMFQTVFGVRHVDGVYWTLWVELLFYGHVALLILFKVADKIPFIYIFSIVWPLTGILLQSLGLSFSQYLIPKHSPLFAAGMLLYLIYEHGHKIIPWVLFSINVALSIYQTLNYDLLGAEKNTGLPLSSFTTAAILLLIYIFLALVTTTRLRFMGWSWMTYAGALTYPLYLIHEYWGWWIIWQLSPVTGKWLTVLTAIAVSFLMAILIEKYIERPLRPRIRKFLFKALTDSR